MSHADKFERVLRQTMRGRNIDRKSAKRQLLAEGGEAATHYYRSMQE
jgi:hypothetical protein